MHCLKWQISSLNLFQILTCTYSLKKVQKVEFLVFLESYDLKEESKQIMYLDVHKFYHYAMCKLFQQVNSNG